MDFIWKMYCIGHVYYNISTIIHSIYCKLQWEHGRDGWHIPVVFMIFLIALQVHLQWVQKKTPQWSLAASFIVHHLRQEIIFLLSFKLLGWGQWFRYGIPKVVWASLANSTLCLDILVTFFLYPRNECFNKCLHENLIHQSHCPNTSIVLLPSRHIMYLIHCA